MSRIEPKIIVSMFWNEQFLRAVAPFIQPEYFADYSEKIIIEESLKFFHKYNKSPTPNIIDIEISNRKDVSDKGLVECQNTLATCVDEPLDFDWLMQSTEKFCKDRSVYNAILESIKIIDGKDKEKTQDAIPKILADALAVSFDSHVGHDYLGDGVDRFDFYHRKQEKLPFDINLLNVITSGGLNKKTLNIVLAGTGGGKSLFMCHVAASTLMQGKNVLYITMEMAEERIAERIDANLMNLTIDELKVIDRATFDNRLNKIAAKTHGKLIIKEYPTASAHSGHFRALLQDLKTKLDFIPDLVVIDYLNICTSARLRMGATVNSYTFIKAIAEELRGLAIEHNVPILSATQTTRSAQNSSDIELTDTSESIGLPQTADLMIALIRSEEMDQCNQMMIKQLKNRYANPDLFKRFIVGVDRAKMKLFEVEQSAQQGLVDSGQPDNTPVFDKGLLTERARQRTSKFDGFKI